MNKDEALTILRDCGALLEGHFTLSSGKHSPNYVQCALVLQHPEQCARLCAAAAEPWKNSGVDVVVTPALGGVVVGYELARQLGVRGIFMERTGTDKLHLRRGFSISSDEKVLLVEDVITTGGSVLEVAEEVKRIGADIVGIATIIDRSSGADLGYRLESCLQLEIPAYESDSCPLCAGGVPVVKPGSKK